MWASVIGSNQGNDSAVCKMCPMAAAGWVGKSLILNAPLHLQSRPVGISALSVLQTGFADYHRFILGCNFPTKPRLTKQSHQHSKSQFPAQAMQVQQNIRQHHTKTNKSLANAQRPLRVWCVVCAVWCVACGVWRVVYGVWLVCVVCGVVHNVWCVVCVVCCVLCVVLCVFCVCCVSCGCCVLRACASCMLRVVLCVMCGNCCNCCKPAATAASCQLANAGCKLVNDKQPRTLHGRGKPRSCKACAMRYIITHAGRLARSHHCMWRAV